MMELSANSWDVFDGWTATRPVETELSWEDVDGMVDAFAAVATERHAELATLLQQWDCVLVDLGGDPTHRDWRSFRPLRLSREEDWSDWLAYLIEASRTGVFAYRLLGCSADAPQDYAGPATVAREVFHSGYRADIVICWANGRRTHIEVKTGDEYLTKTQATGKAMREHFGIPIDQWANRILLLSSQLHDWDAVNTPLGDEPITKAVTWDDACVGLRHGLLGDESPVWKAFAYVFLGTIEQSLVGFPGYRLDDRTLEGLNEKVAILREGLANE